MKIDVSFGWDNHEKALFPNEHRSINLEGNKPCIITGRNGSGKTLSIKILKKMFSVISSTDEDIYQDSKRFFEDIGLSWAKIKLNGTYILGNGDSMASKYHSFQELGIPWRLELYKDGLESDNEKENSHYKIHADIILENLAQIPEIKIDFYLSCNYSSIHSFEILDDDGEYVDEEILNIHSEFYSKKPFQTLYINNLREVNTVDLFDSINQDMLFNEIRTSISFMHDNLEKESMRQYGFDFDEYEGVVNDGDFFLDLEPEGYQEKELFAIPRVEHLKEKRNAPKIHQEFGDFFAELVKIRTRLKPVIDEYNIILESDWAIGYSIFDDAGSLDAEVFSSDSTQKESEELWEYLDTLDCNEAITLIPCLWSTDYKSFKNLGFQPAEEDFDYESSSFSLTIEERRQYFTDINDLFGKISEWPLRDRFKTLSRALKKLIETDLLTKCLKNTSASLPGDSEKNFEYLCDFIHYISYKMYINIYFEKYNPLLRLFEEFFEQDSDSNMTAYTKFLEDINNQEIIPSGYQNLLSLTMSVGEYSHKNDIVVFLDEPEISLHISWQIRLVSFLDGLLNSGNAQSTNISEKYLNKYLVIATHSPDIVSGFLQNTVDFSSNIDL